MRHRRVPETGASAAAEPASLVSVRDEIRALLRPERSAVVVLFIVTLPIGFMGAAVIALVAQAAVAMAAGDSTFTAGVTSLSLTLHVRDAILISGALSLVLLVLSSANAYLPARIVANSQARLRTQMFEDFVWTSWAVQSLERNGHLQEVMTVQLNRSARMTMALLSAAIKFVVFAGTVVSAFIIAPAASALMLGAGTLLFLFFRPFATRSRRWSRTHSGASVDLAAAVNQNVALSEEYQVFDSAQAQIAEVSDTIEVTRDSFLRSETMTRLVGGLYSNILALMLVVGLAGLYFSNVDDLASVGAVVLLLLRSLQSGQGVQSDYTHVQNHMPYFERAMEARRRYRGSRVTFGDEPLETIEQIALDRVAYVYDAEDEEAITDISFSVAAGTSVGLVGPSGSGKSTIVQLLLRLRQPTTGAFRVNDTPAQEFRREDWARLVTYVPQEPKLQLGTIADNIRFHRPGVTDDEIEQAARLAHIHDEIVEWPEGYRRMVGRGGAGVSGGQRQRICLARALVTLPQVVVLDEPTSALDPRSEELVRESLEELRDSGVTFFIIAHRPTTLQFIDRLLVLEMGRMAAWGTPAEVSASNDYAGDALSGLIAPRT